MNEDFRTHAATRRSYDAVAAAHAAHVVGELDGKPLDRALLAAIVELSGDGLIADIGCGPGQVTAHLARCGASVIGLDLSPEMCRLARASTLPVFGAADMTALPVRSGSLAAVVSLYAVIHLDDVDRAAAYREFGRVIRPGGHALVAFHTRDQEIRPGGQRTMSEWFDRDVSLTFRFLDPAAEADALASRVRGDRPPRPAASSGRGVPQRAQSSACSTWWRPMIFTESEHSPGRPRLCRADAEVCPSVIEQGRGDPSWVRKQSGASSPGVSPR